MFWAKAIMPILLWLSVVWFAVTGAIHFPFLGRVSRKKQTALYMGVIFFDLALALFFTQRLLEGT